MAALQRTGTTQVDLDASTAASELLKVQRLARELRLTDQILTFDLDAVAVVVGGPAPAWTTLEGDRITFAYSLMPAPITRRSIAVWLGTNAHELGHVLFSPRRESTLMYRVLEADATFMADIAQLHNIVEDQRQERLILDRFAPWRGYLTAALGYHLDPRTNAGWLLFAGRTWLPQEVRDAARAQMIASHGHLVTDAVTRIVDDYQHLTDPGDAQADAAWALLVELHELFADAMPKMPRACSVMSSTAGAASPDTSSPSSSAPPTAAEPADEADDDDADTDSTSDGDDDDDDDADSGDAADGDDGNAGEGDAQQPKQSKPSDDGNDGKAGDQPAPPQSAKQQILDAASKQIEQDEDAQRDLDAISDALDHGSNAGDAQGESREGHLVEVTDRARRLYVDVADALLDLKDETEPGWQKRTDSGRLNVRRLSNPRVDADELFDRYDAGMMDAAELEVVALLDVSGSMGESCHALGEATWAIRQAVDTLEGTCTVIGWDNGPHRIIAGPHDRPDDRMFIPASMGGTNPLTALREAHRLLAGSDARNRLAVILTDGDWSGARASEEVIRTMQDDGIVTVIALLGRYAGENTHGCRYAASIGEPLELARLFKRVALERIGSWSY